MSKGYKGEEYLRNLKVHFYRFDCAEKVRRYVTFVCPMHVMLGLIESSPYDPTADGWRGAGQQRGLVKSHVSSIRRSMARDDFTDASITLALPDNHRKGMLRFSGVEGDRDSPLRVSIRLACEEFLTLLDGGHRMEAFEVYWKQPDKYRPRLIHLSDVEARVWLDGQKQDHFLNLQKGLVVSKNQIFCMRAQRELAGRVKGRRGACFLLARHLHETHCLGWPVVFEGPKKKGAQDIGINTLVQDGTEKIMSLAGTYRLFGAVEHGPFGVLVREAWRLMADGLEEVKLGHVTMMLGCVNLSMARSALGKGLPPSKWLPEAVSFVKKTLSGKATKESFWSAGQGKRELMRLTAEHLFRELAVEKIEGVPACMIAGRPDTPFKSFLSPAVFSIDPDHPNLKKEV